MNNLFIYEQMFIKAFRSTVLAAVGTIRGRSNRTDPSNTPVIPVINLNTYVPLGTYN